jgi:hypothetical protein
MVVSLVRSHKMCVTYVVDPETKHDTGGNEELVDTSQTTTNCSRRILTDV